MDTELQVGFGRADMTPQLGVQLTGYGNDDKRPAKNILDPLYATCLAFTDKDGKTALVYTMDILYAPGWVRPAIAEAVGLPVESIHISGTHTHSAPVRTISAASVLPGTGAAQPEVSKYLKTTLQSAAIQAAKDALADRKAAQMYTTTTYTENINFVRHYLMADGTYGGPNFGNFNQPIVGHETPVDNSMQLVKFVRAGGKDIILCNFQMHQTLTGGMLKCDVSADIAGAMRAEMEKRTGCLFAYFTGASGNVNPTSRIESEQRFNLGQHVECGQALADYALAVADKYQPIHAGKVQTKSVHLDVEVNHSLDHLADKMQPIADLWAETGDRPRCNKLAQEIGLNSVYSVQSALGKIRLGKTLGITLDVVALGDLAFVMAPYEMFDTNGMEIKAASPFEMTIVATCANDTLSYIPSAIGFEHGGYSVDRCQFVPGTGEQMVEEYVAMLNELHNAK